MPQETLERAMLVTANVVEATVKIVATVAMMSSMLSTKLTKINF
jgi:hypothetical protein